MATTLTRHALYELVWSPRAMENNIEEGSDEGHQQQ